MNPLRINPQPHPVNRPALPGLGRRAQLANAAGGAKQTQVHLNIGRLSVAGMSHREQSRMTDALQQEFTWLVEASPEVDWQALSGLDRIGARPFPAGSTAEDIGRHVASEIFRGLRR
jgi:hypothetical protein